MNNKTDLRIIKTKKSLYQGLTHLMKEKNLKILEYQISVKHH